MSGPSCVPDWPVIARALAASGCDLTDYGESLAAPRRICAWCHRDLGPAPPGSHDDTHGMCQPPCAEAIAMGWGDAA